MAFGMDLKLFLLAAIIFEVAVSSPLIPGESEKQNLDGIIGGTEIDIEDANFNGALFTYKPNDLVGSVTILNNLWVVTTAFNIMFANARDIYVKVGTNSLYDKSGTDVKVAEVYTHRHYLGSWQYNVGLLKLAEPLKFSDKIGSILIAQVTPLYGPKCDLTGFGMNSQKTDGKLVEWTSMYVASDICEEKFSFTDMPFFSLGSFCSLQDDGGPCVGDYGAPFVCGTKLIGIFTGSFGCATNETAAVYTDLTLYKGWIDMVIEDHTGAEEVIEYS